MQRLIEQPSGTGDLLVAGTQIASVHYTLSVYRHYADNGDESGPAYLEGEGHIRALEDFDVSGLARLGLEFGLRLDDGRLLDLAFSDAEGTIHSTGRGLSAGHVP
jgi:hypothetical protein